MATQKRTATAAVTVRCETALAEAARETSLRTGVSLSHVVREALQRFVAEHEQQ